MKVKRQTWMGIGAAACAAICVSGCTSTQTGTAAGAGVGAGLGAIVGNNLGRGAGDRDKGALIGAGVGALVGNTMGRQADTQKQLDARLSAAEQAAQQQTVWITNANGSRTPVVLRQGSGGTWTGPKGETYTSMPTEAQLKPVYGF